MTGRLLVALRYQLLGTEDDFVGMVSDVFGEPTSANPEDFTAIGPERRVGDGKREGHNQSAVWRAV